MGKKTNELNRSEDLARKNRRAGRIGVDEVFESLRSCKKAFGSDFDPQNVFRGPSCKTGLKKSNERYVSTRSCGGIWTFSAQVVK